MLASVRCRPQEASGTGLSTGAPPTGEICSTFASSAEEQRPAYAPRASYQGVEAGGEGCGNPTTLVAMPMLVPGANGAVGMTGSRLPGAPLRPAGFVHRTS